MSWYRSFAKKMFMALASGGKYQTICDCDLHLDWSPGEYIADSIVTHINPNTKKKSLYRARGDLSKSHFTDKINDEPGNSIHWELLCSCEKYGFTPTPTPSLKVEKPTPTPTYKEPEITPTPTPRFLCSDYDVWNPDRDMGSGVNYMYGERVQWKGSVYKVRDKHGAESNDVPGKSNHWEHEFECSECKCAPEHYTHVEIERANTSFKNGSVLGFVNGLVLSFDETKLIPGNSSNITLQLENSNIVGKIYLENVDLPYDGMQVYAEYHGVCYKANIKPRTFRTYELKIISFSDICPTPTPKATIVCGEGYVNKITTSGNSGINKPNNGLYAELFEDGGTLYYNNIKISNLNDVKIYTSLVYKNSDSNEPFGVIVVVGTFIEGENKIVYESTDGTCWSGVVQPHGKNIILHREY